MLILNANQVATALPMTEAIAGMKLAFAALHQGDVVMPPRTHMSLEKQDAISLIMPSYVGGRSEALAVKVVGIFPNNSRKGLDRILGAVMVFDPETGAPQAVLEGATLTGIRTAAVSGAATDYLARENAHVLGVVGSGVQAKTHIHSMCSVRPIQRVQIFGPTSSKVDALIEELASDPSLPKDIVRVDSGDQAARGADIICTVTSSQTAVFSDDSIAPGTHINAVGSSQTTAGEVPASTVCRAVVVVDQREAAWEEAGDIVQPIKQGLIGKEHVVAELGELASGSLDSPRTDDQQVTFFKSVGLAMQDAFAAQICLTNARKHGIGQQVDW